ncbi:MAG: MBOAT family O-acyltransferase [Planctomycetota bacterium]
MKHPALSWRWQRFFFAFQIYCDFSAYSDIATGTARLFGIRLMRNFAYPYFSQSIGEFWRRWHISLSTWFRDYVYFPLGGNRVSSYRHSLNLMTTFLLSGLWHGAAWNFVAWGSLHGSALAGQKWFTPSRSLNPSGSTNSEKQEPVLDDKLAFTGSAFFPSLSSLLNIWTTFLIVCTGWVFFRADSISDAYGILIRIAAGMFSWANLDSFLHFVDVQETALLLLVAFVGIEWLRRNHECPITTGARFFRPVRWLMYTAVIWGTLYLIAETEETPFVYFAF